METAQCFRVLGFEKMPTSRRAVEAAYEQQRQKLQDGAKADLQVSVQTKKLAMRLLEENYRESLRLLAGSE